LVQIDPHDEPYKIDFVCIRKPYVFIKTIALTSQARNEQYSSSEPRYFGWLGIGRIEGLRDPGIEGLRDSEIESLKPFRFRNL
jgi:hypothetical protein